MRILIVNHFGGLSGAERDVLNLLDALDRSSYSPVVACPDGPLAQEVKKRGVKRFSLSEAFLTRSLSPVYWFRSAFTMFAWTGKLCRLIQSEKIDIVHANSFIAALLCSIAARLTDTPLIWHMHDILKPRNTNGVLAKWLGNRAQSVICVSEAVRRHLIEFGIPPSLLLVVYNSMYKPFPVSRLTKETAKNRLGIATDALLVGIVGQIAEWKGQHILLEAIERLSATHSLTNVKFVIVGDVLTSHQTAYREKLERHVFAKRLTDQVLFTGFRDDVPDVLRALDILVHASVWHDPFPTVLLEALTSGSCIIASNVGGVPEILEDGKSGVLFPPGDSIALANALADLLRSPMKRRALANGAERRARSLNPVSNLAKLTGLYDSIAGN